MSYRLRAITIIVVLASCVTHPAHAQSESSGRIEGVVYDSVHARPLADARVVAVGSGAQGELHREATTDSAGHYRFDALPFGRYIVGFESPLLDSLEVTISPREANLTSELTHTLDLALPSAAKLRSAVCFGATLPAQTGVIIGQVVSAETESPVAGVVVAMVWHDITVEKANRLRITSSERSDSVVTDKDGWYRMCGVTTGAWVAMQLRRDNRRGPLLRTRIDDTLGIAVQHLAFSTSRDTTADGPAGTPLSGSAVLTGVVRGIAGTPVASADVRVRGTRAAGRTNDQGTFTLVGLPAGTQQLEVRRIGYAAVEVPVALHAGTTTTHDVALQRVVNLDSIVVVATRTKYPDFYIHKSMGWGRFVGPEAIGQMRVTRTSDYFERIPGFMVRERGGYTTVVSAQGPGGASGNCAATLVVDGMRSLEYPPTINGIHWSDVAAIEAYPASMAFMAPMEYDIGGCGGIVIWTKR